MAQASLVNDGLTADCANNGGTTWTYNQGVIIGGLAVLYEITGDDAYLGQAETIAAAALRDLTVAAGHPHRARRAGDRSPRPRPAPVQGHLRPVDQYRARLASSPATKNPATSTPAKSDRVSPAVKRGGA